MQLVNGVFMGGGAKSIAYLGALRATEERGLWFGSVAGSSAGAITASLIAAGMRPGDMDTAIPSILAAVRTPIAGRLAKAVVGHATSLFEGNGLRSIIDETLATKIGATSGVPITFAQLYEASGIELYVVAMDLATGVPIVFNRRTTPTVEVAGAVAASAAIPGAFPAGRAVLDNAQDGAVVRRLIDGSAYANLPAFVFKDASFRTWLRGESELDRAWTDQDRAVWAAEQDRPMIGYALGDPEPLEHRQVVGLVPLEDPGINRRFDQGPTYTSPKRLTYLVGAVLSSDWVRMSVAVALVIWLSLSIATLPVAVRRFAAWLDSWAGDAFGVLLIGALSIAVVSMLVAAASIALLVLLGRLVGETLLPSLKGVLGVAMDLPPWTGLAGDSLIVFVPDDELSTLDFEVEPDVLARAVGHAHDGVAAQLAEPETVERLDALLAGRQGTDGPYRRGHRQPSIEATPDRVSLLEVAAVIVLAVGVGVATWRATNLAGKEDIWATVLAAVVATAIVMAGIGYMAGRAARRAAARAEYGVGVLRQRPERSSALTMLGGVLLILVGVVLSVTAMNERRADTVLAEVTQAVATDGSKDNTYEVRGADPVDDVERTWTLVSDRHLRLGERVFVKPVPKTATAKLVGVVDDERFAVAVIAGALGVGLLTAGVRTYRWAARCRRLEELLDGWRGSAAT
jgi:predicted acylesterase/phospholipase RssA